MRQQATLTTGPTLDEVRRRFETWRATKEYSSSPIPQPLWDGAIELARAHSIHEISRSLRLDYNRLKKRVDETASQNPALCIPQFVELGFPPIPTEPECILEGERADGARMRLSVKGALDPQMVELAKAFWRGP